MGRAAAPGPLPPAHEPRPLRAPGPRGCAPGRAGLAPCRGRSARPASAAAGSSPCGRRPPSLPRSRRGPRGAPAKGRADCGTPGTGRRRARRGRQESRPAGVRALLRPRPPRTATAAMCRAPESPCRPASSPPGAPGAAARAARLTQATASTGAPGLRPRPCTFALFQSLCGLPSTQAGRGPILAKGRALRHTPVPGSGASLSLLWAVRAAAPGTRLSNPAIPAS